MSLTQAQSTLVDRALRKLDALDSPGSNIVSSQTEIYTVMQEAARLILHEAPLRLLHPLIADATDTVNDDTYWYNIQAAGHTKIVLPSDFLRLAHLELDGWTMGRTHEDLHEDSIVTYRRYLRGEVATTGDPRIFRTWLPARYKGILTFANNPSNGDTFTIGDQTWEFQTIIVTDEGKIGIQGSLAATIAAAVHALNGDGVGSGSTYGSATETLEGGVAVAGATTITVYLDNAAALSASGDTWDASTATLLAQREVIDCFPASADSTGQALVTAFNYVPDTAPESIPTDLVESMLWRTASLVGSPIDPQYAEFCLKRAAEALAPRITRHRSAFTVLRRGMGL